ncbi:MAG: hypothetical protein V1901_04225 [Patescibacteria group bacterium]
MQTLKIEDIEKKINKKIRQNAVSIGFDVSEAYTGVCILRTDKEYIYIENLSVIETSSKDDIKNRMKYFVGAIGKFKQGLNYKEYKIIVVEDSWMGKNVFTLKNLIRFSTLLWMLFYNECDYFYFLLPTSARSQIGFNKNKQIVVGNVSSGVYTRDTKNKQGKILHKKGEKKKIDIKLLIMDYLKQEFKVEIENSDKADAFVLALAGLAS